MFIASFRGNLECVNILLKNKADANICDKYGRSPIMLSAAKGFLEISKLLLQYNASPFILDIYHKNAIDRAKNIEMITLLQTCKKHMKRSKILLIFNNFPIFFKIDIKRFKKSKIGKKVSIRMNEKMIELKNHLSTKFERFLYEIITEENNKANLLISNSVNN